MSPATLDYCRGIPVPTLDVGPGSQKAHSSQLALPVTEGTGASVLVPTLSPFSFCFLTAPSFGDLDLPITPPIARCSAPSCPPAPPHTPACPQGVS